MKTIYPKTSIEPLELLGMCGGYYECPTSSHGKRFGPLVGYAGKYNGSNQWVGEVYVNFAKAERHAPVLSSIADRILHGDQVLRQAGTMNYSTGFCGAPEGGKGLALTLAAQTGKQYIFPEKKILTARTKTSRETSELRFDRHEPEPGESWWIVDDVCNNFSTATTMIDLIKMQGASVSGIICFLNRSIHTEDLYLGYPVISLVRKPIMEYKQDDLFVADDVRNGNVVWNPKIDWDRLAKTMATHPKISQ